MVFKIGRGAYLAGGRGEGAEAVHSVVGEAVVFPASVAQEGLVAVAVEGGVCVVAEGVGGAGFLAAGVPCELGAAVERVFYFSGLAVGIKGGGADAVEWICGGVGTFGRIVADRAGGHERRDSNA